MSREIKFRVWDKARQKYLSDSRGPTIFTPYNCVCNSFREEGLEWEQWTGTTDKDGSPIYEGDIVTTIYANRPNALAVFDFNTCAYRLLAANSLLPIITCRFSELGNEMSLMKVAQKVIGNIHKNPELLQ